VATPITWAKRQMSAPAAIGRSATLCPRGIFSIVAGPSGARRSPGASGSNRWMSSE
jgi:hypothetical protein